MAGGSFTHGKRARSVLYSLQEFLHNISSRMFYLQALVSSGKVDPTVIISHEFSLDQWQDAFDLLLSGKACKIVVKI